MKKTNLIFISCLLSLVSCLLSLEPVFSANPEVLAPPIINFYNKQISNNEIFYISGSAQIPKADVVIYFQREDGALFSQTVQVDEFGRWFYYHPQFLNKGSYIIWTQMRADALISPPSPQINIQVEATAVQIGSARIGFDTLSVIMAFTLLVLILLLIIFIVYHFRQHSHKNKILAKEIAKAEAMVHYGFIDLKKEITAQLASMKKIGSGFSAEEKREKEVQLLKDLEIIEDHLEKELEQLEQLSIR